MTTLAIIAGGVVTAIVLAILIFKAVWKVAEPNEALLISGLGAHGEASTDTDQRGFKVVVGKGTVVIPGFQTVRRFYLGMRNTSPEVQAVSKQSIPVTVTAAVAFKVADDQRSISNAARRFLDQDEASLVRSIHSLFEGHLRAIVGGMTVEDMLHNREELTSQIRTSLADDLTKLGLIVDSLQIQELKDSVGYITNLGKPQIADAESKARIAAAERDREATKAEQEAETQKADAERATEIAKAQFQAEKDEAKARADQAGPLVEAKAKQDVVRAETEAAILAAELKEKQLDTEIRKPADAKAYQMTVEAEANRAAAVKTAEAEREAKILAAEATAEENKLLGDSEAHATRVRGEAQASATELTGLADAKTIEARGKAEGESIKARAEALATNQDAVIAQQIAENYPAIVAAGASALANIDNLVVLNGADGMEDMLGKALTMGGAGLGLAKNLMETIGAGAKNLTAGSGQVAQEKQDTVTSA